MKLHLEILQWDTDFFGYNVGRVEGEICSQKDLQILREVISNGKIRLAYYSSSLELPPYILENEDLIFILVDRKTIYSKSIYSEMDSDSSISALNRDSNSVKLENLAIQSGIYSRFNSDKRIGQEKFEELYRLWMINSIEGKFAKEILVYKEEGEIAGLVTLRESNNRADIGIIAVDERFRGKGIGKKLMSSAEKYFFNMGYTSIQVVTQGSNIPACKLYESCGYSVESVKFFYHIWNK